MRGSAPDIVLSSSNKAAQYALQSRQNAMRQQQLQQEQQQKQRDANLKNFMDLYKIDPGKPWERFNDRIYDDANHVRDWVAAEQYKGTQATDPNFQREYNQRVDNVKRASEKSTYIKDVIAKNNRDAADNKYLDAGYFARRALEETTDANGQILHPDQVDMNKVENVYRDTKGFNVAMAANDFVKNSPEDLVSWIQQENSRYGGTLTSREEITSKLFQTERTPNGSYRIKTDPATGLPVMNITDDVINRWKADDWSGRWLQDQVKATGIDPYQNPKLYKEVERNILEQYLSPYAHSQKKIASASYAQPKDDKNYQGSGLNKDKFENAMVFKRRVEDYKNGDLSLVEANPNVGAVVRDGAKDFIYGKDIEFDENGKVLSGQVIDVIDRNKPDGDVPKIHQWMYYTNKPTTTEILQTPPYSPEEGRDLFVGPLQNRQPEFTDKAMADDILNGKNIGELLKHEGIKSAEYGNGQLKITTTDGKVQKFPANEINKARVLKILTSPLKQQAKKAEPAKAAITTTPRAATLGKMPFDINN